MKKVIKLLDLGYVKLVDKMGTDLSVVRNARQSFDAAWRAGLNIKSDAGLVRYLYSHMHSTPFESVEANFQVKAPIFVFRQWHRHRTQSYNEQSARYMELPEQFYTPKAELIGVQAKKNKQGREIPIDPKLFEQRMKELEEYDAHCEAAFALYRKLLASEWPRELARGVLPLCTYSTMSAKANLWNWFRFMHLRSDAHAQYEIRVYSDAIHTLLQPIAPVCMAAFDRYKFKVIDTQAAEGCTLS